MEAKLLILEKFIVKLIIDLVKVVVNDESKIFIIDFLLWNIFYNFIINLNLF